MEIQFVCRKCRGTGQLEIVNNPPQPCDRCSGTGRLDEGEVINVSNIYYSYLIVEATEASEYNALSAGNKDAYQMIVSCGIVDLSDGTTVRTKLWNMFGEGTTTRDNLVSLIS